MEKNQILGACGLYCGACNHYRFSFTEGEHLLRDSNPKNLTYDKFTCRGCHSDKSEMLPGCAGCKIRECSKKKKISHCGSCNEFPCKLLTDFKNDGRIHHQYILKNLQELNTKGVEQWLIEQENRWKCECGYNYSWYEESCYNCGMKLNSYKKSK